MSTHRRASSDDARRCRRTVRLPTQLDERAAAAVEAGEFESVSAVLREGLKTILADDRG